MRYNHGGGNFGDAINLMFWSKITQRNIRTKFNYNTQPHFLTTGSIMELATDKSIIFGSGFISQNSNLGGQVFSSNSNKKNLQSIGSWSKRSSNKRKIAKLLSTLSQSLWRSTSNVSFDL